MTVLGYPDRSAASGYRFRIVAGFGCAGTAARRRRPKKSWLAKPMDEAAIAEAAQAAMDACTPIDDTRGSARYRKLMVRNLTRNALVDIWTKIRK